MDQAEKQFLQACEAWARLTLAEGRAIAAADWPRVDKCQSAKTALQARLQASTDAFRRARAAAREQARAAERQVQDRVGRLLALERQNEAALAVQFRRAQQQQAELAQTRRTLRAVRHAYVPATPFGWESRS